MCPIDFGGKVCDHRRHFTCSWTLVRITGTQESICTGAEQLLKPDPDVSSTCMYISKDVDAFGIVLEYLLSCRLAYHNMSTDNASTYAFNSSQYEVFNISQVGQKIESLRMNHFGLEPRH